jgi:hypothetical protein
VVFVAELFPSPESDVSALFSSFVPDSKELLSSTESS